MTRLGPGTVSNRRFGGPQKKEEYARASTAASPRFLFFDIAILQTVEKHAHLGEHHSETGCNTIFKVHYEKYCFPF